MSRKITLFDFFQEKRLETNRDKFLRLLDDSSKNLGSLRVTIRATHSGSLVNNRVYPGVHVRDSVKTWTKPYKRPVLIHHASGGGIFGGAAEDPRGRVISAKFIQLKEGKAFIDDFKRPSIGGMGSGYILLEAEIVDGDAIQKILDGRYLTVSSSQTTDSMICSICGQDWFEGFCDHMPGRKYFIDLGKNKKSKKPYLCYGITGPLVYREVSFVNIPAQVNAQVLGVLKKDSDDGLSMVSWDRSNAIDEMALCDSEGEIIHNLFEKKATKMEKDVNVMVPGYDPEESEIDKETNPDNPSKPETDSEPASQEPEEGEEDKSEVVPVSDEEFALANIVKSFKDNGLFLPKAKANLVFDGETEDVENDGKSHTHLIFIQKVDDKRLLGRTYATIGDVEEHSHTVDVELGITTNIKTRDADVGFNHTHDLDVVLVEDEFDDETLDELVKVLEEASENEEDAKLTAAQRKKLKSSTFCGPNKSFPVPDCAHVTAARRLIGRYKGSAETKSRILSCVNRKAKKLGCTSAKKSKKGKDAQPEGEPKKDETFETLLTELAVTKTKLERIEANLTEKSQEIQELENDLAREKAARSTALANTLVIVRMILSKPDCLGIDNAEKFEEKVTHYASRTPESLWDAVSDLLPEMDMVIQNIRKAKGSIMIFGTPPAKDEKLPLKHRAKKTNDRNPTRRKVRKAEQLAKELEN